MGLDRQDSATSAPTIKSVGPEGRALCKLVMIKRAWLLRSGFRHGHTAIDPVKSTSRQMVGRRAFSWNWSRRRPQVLNLLSGSRSRREATKIGRGLGAPAGMNG
jgi:hypothetical protein